jgi:SAM-dependent methyltransferase
VTAHLISSREYYDRVATSYDEELRRRADYLAAIDEVVVRWVRSVGARSILDVGCGNGARLQHLLARTGGTGVGIDESPGMVAAARARGVDAHVIDIAAAPGRVPLPPRGFDVVLALWNVLGHLDGPQRRLRALEHMRALLARGGLIIFDVNNRYNAAQYGWRRVAWNVARDLLGDRPGGDFVARRTVGDTDIATVSHVFCPGEILHLCREAGLHPRSVDFVDYNRGSFARSQWTGQVCVVAEGPR